MKTINESYQNSNYSTNNKIKETVTKNLFKLHAKSNRIFILGKFNVFLLDRKKISFEIYSNNHHRTNKKIVFNNGQISILKKERDLLLAS